MLTAKTRAEQEVMEASSLKGGAERELTSATQHLDELLARTRQQLNLRPVFCVVHSDRALHTRTGARHQLRPHPDCPEQAGTPATTSRRRQRTASRPPCSFCIRNLRV